MPVPPKLTVHERVKPVHSLLENMHDGEWLDNQTFADTMWAIPGIVPEGFCILSGPPKVGKSWLSLNLALSIADGTEALGGIPISSAKPVLYLTLEDGNKRVKKRTKQLLNGRSTPKNFKFLTKLNPKDLAGTLEAFYQAFWDPALPPVIILDTLGKVMAPAKSGESAYQRDYRVGTELKDVVDNYPGSTLVVVHHNRKQESEDFVDQISGTQGLAGSADTILVLTRPRHKQEASLNVAGRDLDEEGEYSLIASNGFWKLEGNSLKESAEQQKIKHLRVNLADQSQIMLAWIMEHGEVTSSEFEQEFGADTRKYLQRFAKANRIQQVRRGVYAPIELTESTA